MPVFLDDKVSKVAGRTTLSKALKKALMDKYGAICFVYLQPMEERLLQVDHRIPYEIGGGLVGGASLKPDFADIVNYNK